MKNIKLTDTINGMQTDEYGNKRWYKDGKVHRDGDKPAVCEATTRQGVIVEWATGYKSWYTDGKLHRNGDKPAIEHEDGRLEWRKDGKLHRDGDKPAIEHEDGRLEWYKDGKLHRDGDKPAVCEATTRQGVIVECANGDKWWFKNGKRHREGDKPAIECIDGDKDWFKHGVQYDPNWKDVHTRLAVKIANVDLPMLILLEVASRILCKQGLTDYQVTEIISCIRN